MTHTCRYSHTLKSITILFAFAVLFTRPSAAQYDLQIMVNGPWDYVIDPNPGKSPTPNDDRLVLVAPASMSHKAYIFEGTNATKPGNVRLDVNANSATDLSFYYLDFDPAVRNPDGIPPNEEPAITYRARQTVTSARIMSILDTPGTTMR